jgi:hypothetical protein
VLLDEVDSREQLLELALSEDLLDLSAVLIPDRQPLCRFLFQRVIGGVDHDAVAFTEEHPVAHRRPLALLLRPACLHLVFVDDGPQVRTFVEDAVQNPADELLERVTHRELETDS